MLSRELQDVALDFLPSPSRSERGRRQEEELQRNLPKESPEQSRLRPQACGAAGGALLSIEETGPSLLRGLTVCHARVVWLSPRWL